MSKGSRIVNVRINDELYMRMFKQIEGTNETRKGEPFDVSGFIRQAIEDKLAHNKRSRCWRKSRGLGKCPIEDCSVDSHATGSIGVDAGGNAGVGDDGKTSLATNQIF